MVRAILEGRKFQTRRIVKPQPAFVGDESNSLRGHTEEALAGRCPYGVPGDRLWVRETFANCVDSSGADDFEFTAYKATAHRTPASLKWTPSIHMPRWASRITLEVVNVRVERLQDISEADAKAEGLESAIVEYLDDIGYKMQNGDWTNDPVFAYRSLWESINGPGSWDENPWVWVVEFKRVEGKR